MKLNTANILQSITGSSKPEGLKSIQQTVNSQKYDLFNQIVERAKMVLKDAQTEMEMTLKPESLGKLTLKLVSENGTVVANITTESYQVKQTIESNMAQLQNSLKEQGLNIGQFNVNVGQDKRHEFLNNQMSNLKSKIAKLNSNTIEVSEGYLKIGTVNNPYLVSESSFDYSA